MFNREKKRQMRVAQNVYAVLDMFHPIGVNAGFIVTKKHIVYVDAGWTIPSAQTILGYSFAVAPNNKPKYLVFTDHHIDHIAGMKTIQRSWSQNNRSHKPRPSPAKVYDTELERIHQ